MTRFIFDGWDFDQASRTAEFRYFFEGSDEVFTETMTFAGQGSDYDREALVRALDLAHLIIGTSYYKSFPTREVGFTNGDIDEWQAGFLNKVYQEGLSQFAFENNLTRDDLAHFEVSGEAKQAVAYAGQGVISLQSGGKDSLLVAALLKEKNTDFSVLYISSSEHYPGIIDQLKRPVRIIQRYIDKEKLLAVQARGGKNGHVPVTFIVLATSLVQAVLDGKNTILAAIGYEGEEPHAYISDLPVTHQWSKTWEAEQLFAEYVKRYISPDIHVGSLLRQYSEVKIAELFVQKCWSEFGNKFSSCNVANYGQGIDNSELKWCGACPKCANSYLLFAPFVPSGGLQALFGDRDLFAESELQDTFKGLLGIDDVMKPFECVGEIDELRWAYHAALTNGYQPLSFDVPQSNFDRNHQHPAQMIQL